MDWLCNFSHLPVPTNNLLLSDVDASFPCSVFPPLSAVSFCLHSHCIHQILDSVSYTHQHDIVHRDLKVCVCAFHYVAFVCTLCTGVALHLLVFIYLFFLPVI